MTANPTTQWKIEPVSDLRLQKFGNIAEVARRFPTEFSADLKIREFRDSSLSPKAPQRREFSRHTRGRRRDRTGWLPWQDSNRHIPFSKKPFEIPRELQPNLSHYGTRDFSRGSCWKWEEHPRAGTKKTHCPSRQRVFFS